MFTDKQNVEYWASRWRFTRTWRGHRGSVWSDISMANYRNMLVAEFTYLFNRQNVCRCQACRWCEQEMKRKIR